MKRISNAELEVMQVIWSKQNITSLEIIKGLQHKSWNDNTIRTLINRLIYKKAVGIAKKEGKTYIYVSLINKDEYILKSSNDFVNQFFNGSISDCINFLIKHNTEKLKMELAVDISND